MAIAPNQTQGQNGAAKESPFSLLLCFQTCFMALCSYHELGMQASTQAVIHLLSTSLLLIQAGLDMANTGPGFQKQTS